jgi:hypothetical protein
MPWTRKQVRYLLSSGSPLSDKQREKMKGELHDNPKLGHKKKDNIHRHHSANDGSFIDDRRCL